MLQKAPTQLPNARRNAACEEGAYEKLSFETGRDITDKSIAHD